MTYLEQLPSQEKKAQCLKYLSDPSKFKEDNVRHYVLILLGLDSYGIVESNTRVDFKAENLWIEFKRAVDFTRPVSRAIVVGQMLQYFHDALHKGERLPQYFALVDNDEFLGFKTENFKYIYRDPRWFGETSASKVEDALVEKLVEMPEISKRSPLFFVKDYEMITKSINSLLERPKDINEELDLLRTEVKELKSIVYEIQAKLES